VTNGTATSRAELENEWRAPKLPTVVAPLTPEVDYGPCEEPGREWEAHLVPVPTEGITYSYDEAAVHPGAAVEAEATALPGYELAPAPGWDVREDGSATTTVTIEASERPPEPQEPYDDPEPAPAEESEEPEAAEESDDDEEALAETGASATGLLAIATGLCIGGVTILSNRWRRT